MLVFSWETHAFVWLLIATERLGKNWDLTIIVKNESCGKAAMLIAMTLGETDSLFLGGVATCMLSMPQ